MNESYQLGLLCFCHLLIGADGVVHPQEKGAFELLRTRENVSEKTYQEFERIISEKKDRDLYNYSVSLLNRCSDAEKLRVFTVLYKLSEVDGRVHVNEIRLLLYSIKLVNVEFNDVVSEANALPALI